MKHAFALALGILLLPGCCTCQERYHPALEQWRSNLEERVRPSYEEALEDSPLPDELKESKLGVLDDTIRGIRRVDGEGPEVWSEGGGE